MTDWLTAQINSSKNTKLIHKQNPKKKKMEFQKKSLTKLAGPTSISKKNVVAFIGDSGEVQKRATFFIVHSM